MFEVWVIYDHPSDHPDHFVVRRQFAGKGEIVIDQRCWLCNTLAEARQVIPPGLVQFARNPEDDPVIVESWF